MKKVLLIASMLLTVSVSSFASAFPINFNMGIWGYAGGCFAGPGLCISMPGAPGDFLDFDKMAGVLKIEITPVSSQYHEFSTATFEFGDDSYLPQDVVNAMGLGSSVVFIKAGVYNIVEESNGTRSIQVDYEIQ